MASDEDGRAGAAGDEELRALCGALMQAIAAEPVPEAIVTLAQALERALASRQGAERVVPQLRSETGE